MDIACARQHLAALSCSMALASTGAAFLWFAPLMLYITSKESPVSMTPTESSWLVSSINIGCTISVLPVAALINKLGRKYLILASGPVCAATFVGLAYLRSLAAMIALRLVQGLCLATVLTACPIYVAEVSEPRIRGSTTSHLQTFWSLGVLFTYCIGPYVTYRAYAFACLCLPFIFVVTFVFMPESPYFLIMKGRKEEAKRALLWFRGYSSIQEELKSIEESVEKENLNKGSWRELFLTKKDRNAFFIVQLCAFTKYMGGMNALATYVSQTFGESTPMSMDYHQLTIAFGVLTSLATFSSCFITDRFGRRPLLIFSCYSSSAFLILIGVYYFMEFQTSVNVTPHAWVLYVSLVGYIIAANVGLGPLMQTVQAEFFSSKTRGIGGGLTLVVSSIFSFLCIKQYQFIQDTAGVYLNYWIYALVSLLGAVSMYFFLPETAGRSLGQIQKDMDQAKTEHLSVIKL